MIKEITMYKPMITKGESLFNDGIPVYLNISKEMNTRNCPLHKHDFIEIAYVYSGTGVHLIGDREYPVSKGKLCIINYGIPHLFIRNNDNITSDLIVYNCVFKPEFIDYSLLNSTDFKDITGCLLFNAFFVENNPGVNLTLEGVNQSEIENIYKKMQIEYFAKQKGYVNILRSCLIELLTKIFRLVEDNKNQKPLNNKQHIIKLALDFLMANYSSHNLGMEEIAMKTFLSRSYLSKLFKEVTGQNFSEYLQNLRISHACKLLETTNKKVTEIMLDVGFKDTKHFNSLFKKIAGKTPTGYRKLYKNGV